MHDATLIGVVQDVRGSTVSVLLGDETVAGLSYVDGSPYRIGQVGSFVRVPLGYVSLFGVVSQVGAGAVPERIADEHPHGKRWLTVQLVGEGERRNAFQRGISQYPTIGDSVHLVTENDLRLIYGRPEAAEYVRIGSVASTGTIPALLDVNRLISRHSAVVGATGSGKSTTVVSLVRQLSDEGRYPGARMILIDIHGEYAAALHDRAEVFRVNPALGEKQLAIPYWALTFDELIPLTFGSLEDAARSSLMDIVAEYKKRSLALQPRAGVSADTLTVDSPVPFSIHQLWYDLYGSVHGTFIQEATKQKNEWEPAYVVEGGLPRKGDVMAVSPPVFRPPKNIKDDPEKIQLSDSSLNIRRPLATLAAKLRDPRLAFLFKPAEWASAADGTTKADLDSLLSTWMGSEKPIAILDLSGVPTSILNQLIAALLRITYDAIFWARSLPEGGRKRPLLVVLEEAHAYLNREKAPAAAEAVSRIAKEGRKYGMSAMIVSQRPAEIDPTILSQCGTIIAMRLTNEADRKHVAAAASDTLEGLFAMLPVLRVGEAIVVGEAVNLPVRTLIDPPDEMHMPDSRDPKAVIDSSKEPRAEGGWNNVVQTPNYSRVVEVWRRQSLSTDAVLLGSQDEVL